MISIFIFMLKLTPDLVMARRTPLGSLLKKKSLSFDREVFLHFLGFHLLAARHVETGSEVVGLAFRLGRITVARQRRTFTGFAMMPSHPGVRRLSHFYLDGKLLVSQAYHKKISLPIAVGNKNLQ
jgi:hypothetical protein